ncbi:MAG: peptide-binding protein [Candidatus Wallbacteria bacterium]|nr:peptide-binding protein [Candidatus Wallbacteria bacterium]
MRTLTAAWLLLTSFAFISGCGGKPASHPASANTMESFVDSPSYGDTIVDSSIADAMTLNPLLYNDRFSLSIIEMVFDSLVVLDEKLQIKGDLAESWEQGQDSRELIIHLHQGIKWHDGVPFSAEDVKFTYDLLLHTVTPIGLSSTLDEVDTLEIIDPFTLRARYKKITSSYLKCWLFQILPRHLYQGGNLAESSYNRQPVGTGPFRFVEWVPQEKIILKANSDYFTGRPFIDNYICTVIPDPSMAYLGLLRGDIDILRLTPDQYLKHADETEFKTRYNIQRFFSLDYTFLGFNLDNPLFSDRLVRRALTMAVNRQAIIDDVLYGYGKQISGPFPPDYWAYDRGIMPWPYSTSEAVTLLSQAGYRPASDGILEREGRRFSFTISTNNGNEIRRLVALQIQKCLQEIGVDVRIERLEWGDFSDRLNNRQLDAALLGFFYGPHVDPYSFWHSSMIPDKEKKLKGLNTIGYSNPEADRLLEEYRSSTDRSVQEKLCHQLHAILHQDQPMIFLFSEEKIVAVDKRIRQLSNSADGFLNFTKAFIPEGLQKY